MTVQDLEKVTKEFEEINKSYRQTFTYQSRMELLERVKKLIMMISQFEFLKN